MLVPHPKKRSSNRLLFWCSVCTLLFTFLGTAFVIIAYLSILPLILAIIHLTAILTGMILLGVTGREDLRLAILVFSAGWMAMGIGGIFLEVYKDPGQLSSDAMHFFRLASAEDAITDLETLRRLTGGALAVVLWQWVYDLFAMIGFPRAQYVGIMVNVSVMTVAAILGGRMIQTLFNENVNRLRRYALLFASSGLFWLFAGLHLRDAIATITVTFLTFIWVRYLASPGSFRRLVFMVAFTMLLTPFLTFLRTEYFIFPVLYLATAAFSFQWKDLSNKARMVSPLIMAIAIASVILLVYQYGPTVQLILEGRQSDYADLSYEESGAGSVSFQLIVNQPTVVRFPMGLIYLAIMPVPIWSGFGQGSALLFFRSVNVFSFYLITAMIIAAVTLYVRNKLLRRPPLTFILISSLIFVSAIALTSLEVRHVGTILPGLLVFVSLLDGSKNTDQRILKNSLALVLIGAFAAHILWIAAAVI